MMQTQHYPFSLPPLPYEYDALEPYIDAETMHYHHDKHFKTYIDNLNKALEGHPEYHTWTLEKLLRELPSLPQPMQTAVRNNAGGAYSHDMYFDSMTPGGAEPSAALQSAITSAFGTLTDFADAMKKAALGVFGSGYAWLVQDDAGKLTILPLPNQDNPLTQGLTPILPLDVWEHAYYLKYKNLRADYIDAWFHLIDWKHVSERLR